MKNLILLLSIFFITSCQMSKKSQEPSNPTESATPSSQAQNIKAVSHFVVKESIDDEKGKIIDEPYDIKKYWNEIFINI